MTIAYINGDYKPLEEIHISPLDRGFLFGDGVYEVIPSYQGKTVGLGLHLERLVSGLNMIQIDNIHSLEQWKSIINQCISRNQTALGDNIGVYLHVSRGADSSRAHGFPTGITPTVFAYAFSINPPPNANDNNVVGASVALTEDKRWQRCHIKSTALLGNVLHYQQGKEQGCIETVLYNSDGQVTEASSSNVFIVKDNVVLTPPLDHQLLPGITRTIALESMRREGIHCAEQTFTVEDMLVASEVWLSSSSKELLPVTQVDGHTIGNGEVGAVWRRAQNAYTNTKFLM